MTSSFQNIVGTPRDQVPDISRTNYLEIDSNLTDATNQQINEDIKETRRHFDQMVELERLAASKFSKRLSLIASIAGSVGSIAKKINEQEAALEADGVGRAARKEFQEDIENRAEEAEVIFENEQNTGEAIAKGEIKKDETLTETEKLELIDGFIPDEEADYKMNESISFYKKESIINNVDDLMRSKGAYNSRSNDEFNTHREEVIQSFLRTAAYNEIKEGRDPNSRRFKRKLIREVLPLVLKRLDKSSSSFQFDLKKNILEDQSFVRTTRIARAVETAFKSVDGKAINDTVFKEGGIIDQIAIEENISGAQARSLFFTEVGQLVKTGAIEPEAARNLISGVPYVAANEQGKTYDSLQDYVDKQKNQTSDFVIRANSDIRVLTKIIGDVESKAIDTEKQARLAESKQFVKDQVIPLILENKQKGIVGLSESQGGALITEFINAPFYVEGETPIPEEIKTFFKEAYTGGSRDPLVTHTEKYKEHYTTVREFIERRVTALDAATNDLSNDDVRIVERLMTSYKDKLYGEQGKGIEVTELAISQGNYTLNDRRDEILGDLFSADNLAIVQKAIERGPTPLAESGAATILKVREQINKDPDYFKSKTHFDGEPVNNLFDFVNTGGKRNREIIQYYEALKVRRVNDDGEVEVLSGTEAIYDRAETLQLYDPKTRKVNPYAPILKTITQKNDMANKPNDTKALRNFNDQETSDFTEALKIWAKNSGGLGENSYEFVRAGRKSERKGLTGLTVEQVVRLANKGSTNFGLYGLSSEAIKDMLTGDNAVAPSNARFTEDLQSFLVIKRMQMKANRTNSIRGAITKDTKDFRRMINLQPEELEVINRVFPNLKQSYFDQFQNLQADVAKLIISDLEQRKLDRQERREERRKKEEIRRSKTKRQLRGLDD